MTAPFIFIGTHRVKAGRLDEFKKYFSHFSSDVVESAEPRLHSFYGYTAPGCDEITVVQVHPDAASMVTHMKVGMEHFAAAYAEYLEPESNLQIYGVLDEELMQTISAAARTDGSGSSVTIREPFTGFDRLPPL